MSDATDSSNDAVTLSFEDDVAVIRLDDGKANVLSNEVLDALSAAVHRATTEADAIALIGRPGRFSAGFHLPTITAGPESARAILKKGFELSLQIYRAPVPVVIGCTGHALAMGAILLLSADLRIGADGAFKVGLNEVAIGMAMPRFVIELAHQRLSPPHLLPSLQLARLTDPAGAVRVGFLDEVVAPEAVESAALAAAADLATTLRRTAFRTTREYLRGPHLPAMGRALDADLESFVVEAEVP